MAKEDCVIYREWLQQIEKTSQTFMRTAIMGKMIRHVKKCPVCNGSAAGPTQDRDPKHQ